MNTVKTAFQMFLLMTFITGICYPLLIFGFGFLFFQGVPDADLIHHHEKIVGSRLIGQKFEKDLYFFSRPSAGDYNPLKSGGSNLGPTSFILREQVRARRKKMAELHGTKESEVPSELLFASGSGLDPHISTKTAYFQIDRIVKARKLDPINGKKLVRDLIDRLNDRAVISKLNESYVNVLLLNISLDNMLENQK